MFGRSSRDRPPDLSVLAAGQRDGPAGSGLSNDCSAPRVGHGAARRFECVFGQAILASGGDRRAAATGPL